jgi:hypothetical protein
MIALLPLSESAEGKFDLVDLSAVAGHERTIPSHLLSDGLLSVNQRFVDYVFPLAGCLPEAFRHASLSRKL